MESGLGGSSFTSQQMLVHRLTLWGASMGRHARLIEPPTYAEATRVLLDHDAIDIDEARPPFVEPAIIRTPIFDPCRKKP